MAKLCAELRFLRLGGGFLDLVLCSSGRL